MAFVSGTDSSGEIKLLPFFQSCTAKRVHYSKKIKIDFRAKDVQKSVKYNQELQLIAEVVADPEEIATASIQNKRVI